MSRKLFRILLRRRIMVIFLLLMQLAMLVLLIANGSRMSVWIEYGFTVISICVVFHVAGESSESAYKLIWIVLILSLPLFGGLFYILFNFQSSMRRLQKKIMDTDYKTRPLLSLPGAYFHAAGESVPELLPQINYLQAYAGFPVYGRTKTEYLTPGDVKLNSLIAALKKAEKYIFLEYFSIQEGVMWNTILEILREKAKHGVEVRIIYDDIGCFLLLPKDYPKTLEKMGIQAVIFNPVRPFLSTKQNNRDHRKIAVVDGKVAITGGINLADEYINAVDKYGHWKDAAIMVEGSAAWSFTVMFLRMWAVCKDTREDIAAFYPWKDSACPTEDDGWAQPYADSPVDNDRVGENVYLQIISNAKKYIYINTPYLIIDDQMISALSLAAKSGIDVRIVTPHRPDKQYVHIVTRSFYRELISAGVKIYEYSDGFIHSKTFVSDDKVAAVGTANLDYRSLYLSFECGVCLYKTGSVGAIRDDFIKTLEKCCLITEADCKSGRFLRIIQVILRLFAPLL